MAVKGYSNQERVRLALGRALSDDEIGRHDFVAEAAEAYIDGCVGRGWLEGAVVAEPRPVEGGKVWLRRKPITAVSVVRSIWPFSSTTTLTAVTGYLVDVRRGLVTLSADSQRAGGMVEVDYTYPQTVPADISEAATLLTAHWLASYKPEAGLYKQIAVSGDLSLTYRDQADLGTVPGTVEELLAHYRRPALV